MMNSLPQWCGWEQAAYVTRFTVGDFSELWSGVTRIFTVGLKWNLGQEQGRVGTGAILDRCAPCTAAFCVVAVTLSPLACLHGSSKVACRDGHSTSVTLSPTICHCPALGDQEFSRTGNASFRAELSLPCGMWSVSNSRVVSHLQPHWFLLGRVRLGFVACSNARCTCEVLDCDICVMVQLWRGSFLGVEMSLSSVQCGGWNSSYFTLNVLN